MVHAVASRVAIKPRISKAVAKQTKQKLTFLEHLADKADAPQSVNSIPVGSAVVVDDPEHYGEHTTTDNAVIRNMGTSRRVFLLEPHLSAKEIEGLAFRLTSLSKSEAINSVLIATDNEDDLTTNCLPRYMTKPGDSNNFASINVDFEPKPNHTWHVCGGYDPLEVAAATSEDEKEVQYLTESLQKLAIAVKGDQMETRVPVITMPHGAITDGGYALCLGGYVLATKQTSFQILNPSRGLSLDPIGLSYILPRLGKEYNQYCAKKQVSQTCGMILALGGYEADCYDMVETGLATHIVEQSPEDLLPMLEHTLATLPAWEQQKLVQKPKHYYGQRQPYDSNAKFRNYTIAQIIEEMTDYSANSENSLPIDYGLGMNSEDPALDSGYTPWHDAFFSTDLVDMAIEFNPIFKQEKSIEGIIERLKEVAGRDVADESEQLASQWANDLVVKMESQSPLALRVTHQLLKMGDGFHSSFEHCMDLEAKALQKMFTKQDFQEWSNHVRKHSSESEVPKFTGWQHTSVADVTAEEVDEILS